MIWGTSKMLSASGPVDLLTITKMLQQMQNNMGASWKHIIIVNLGLTKCWELSKMYVLGTMMFFYAYVCYLILYHMFCR